MDYMEQWKTLSGMTLKDALRKMIEVLPPDAYTAVPGGADLTDINPAYLTQVATEAFGICGVGWYFDYDPIDVSIKKEVRKRKDREDREVWVATIQHLHLHFAYTTKDDGEVKESFPVVANGSSENDSEGYALRGALTSAIGAAFSKLCWQLLVYQGKITHHNAGAAWAKRNGGDNADTNKKPAAASAAPVTTQAEATSAEAGKTEKKPKADKPKAETKPAATPESGNGNALMALNDALQVVIPDGLGVPMAGKTLEVASNNAMMGNDILKYLAGQQAKRDGGMFTPETDTLKSLQLAAQTVLASKAN